VGNSVPLGSLDYSLVKEAGISVPLNKAVLFISLFVVGIFFGKGNLVLVFKLFLNGNVMRVRGKHLEVLDLVLNIL
jgi:hypothetical protein